jgi:hypothetical protein
VWSRARVQAT